MAGVYSGRLVVDGEAFDSELELTTNPGGGVRGRFHVRQPLVIDGRVEGAVVNDLLRLTVTYDAGDQDSCSGRIEGILTVEPGGDVIEGPATIFDCAESIAARLSFRRE